MPLGISDPNTMCISLWDKKYKEASHLLQILLRQKSSELWAGFPRGIESIEFQNQFSRPWKSFEFGQNVHKILKKYGNSEMERNQSFWAESSLIHYLVFLMLKIYIDWHCKHSIVTNRSLLQGCAINLPQGPSEKAAFRWIVIPLIIIMK